MERNKEDRSLGELFAELSRGILTLVRQEMEFAKAEMSQKVSRTGKDIGFMIVGGALAYAGFLAVMAALIISLAAIMPLGAAALLVGIVLAIGGYVLIEQGRRKLRREEIVPRETIEALKEDKEWFKGQMT